jgi:anti-sigma factor RsiW
LTDLTRPVQEDDLHVYVDDRLDTARRAEVASHLQANPALQRRVEDWCQQAEALRDAMALKLHEPVPQ